MEVNYEATDLPPVSSGRLPLPERARALVDEAHERFRSNQEGHTEPRAVRAARKAPPAPPAPIAISAPEKPKQRAKADSPTPAAPELKPVVK